MRLVHNNYLLTKSEIFTGKSQAEILPYLPRDTEVNMEKSRLGIFPSRPKVWG